MTEGRISEDGKSVIYPQPELEGIACEVQHSVQSGKPFTAEPGMIGAGVVVMPTGEPRVILQTKHADGTSLSGTLRFPDLMLLLECMVDAGRTAQGIADKTAADRKAAQ